LTAQGTSTADRREIEGRKNFENRVSIRKAAKASLNQWPFAGGEVSQMLCHDPRISNIRWEFHETRNAVLIMAHLSDKSGDWVDWEEIAVAADDCDWPRDGAGRAIKGTWKP
jgi:hypothetical protein